MENLWNYLKKTLLKISICGNVCLLIGIVTNSTVKEIETLLILAIPIVILWGLGILKWFWNIIAGIFNSFSGDDNTADEDEQIITAYKERGYIYIETTKHKDGMAIRCDVFGENLTLVGYTSTTVSIREGDYVYVCNVKGKWTDRKYAPKK